MQVKADEYVFFSRLEIRFFSAFAEGISQIRFPNSLVFYFVKMTSSNNTFFIFLNFVQGIK